MRVPRRLSPVVLLLVCLAVAASAAAQPAPLPRVAIDERLQGPPLLEPALDARASAPTFPVAVRLSVRLDELSGAQATTLFDRLDRRLASYAARHIQVWLALELGPDQLRDAATRAAVVRQLSARVGARVAIYEVAPLMGAADPKAVAFAVKQSAIELRAGAAVRIALGGIGAPSGTDAATGVAALYREDLAPYIDGVVLAAGGGAAADAINSLLARDDPGSFVAMAGVRLSVPDTIVAHELDVLGRGITATSYAGGADEVRAALARARGMASLLSATLVRLDPAAASLATTPESVRAILLYDTQRFGTTLVYARAPGAPPGAGGALDIVLTLRGAGRPSVRDPFDGAQLPVAAFERDEPARRTRVRVPLRDRPLIARLRRWSRGCGSRADRRLGHDPALGG